MKKWLGLPLASLFALQAAGSGEAQTFTDDAYTVTAAFHVTGRIQPDKSKTVRVPGRHGRRAHTAAVPAGPRADYEFYSVRAANAGGDVIQCVGLRVSSPKHLWAVTPDRVLASMLAPTDNDPSSFGGCVRIGADEGLSFRNPAISLYDAGKKAGVIAMPAWTDGQSPPDAGMAPFDLSAGNGCRAGWRADIAAQREGSVLPAVPLCPRL
jgi:hypothetical protein